MDDNKQLKNEELETVTGGTNVESFDGFSVGDWVTFKPESKIRHSSSGGSPLSRASYRIREIELIIDDYAIAHLDVYEFDALGDYHKRSYSNSSLDELMHAHEPLNFSE